jgi:hypothetical protein
MSLMISIAGLFKAQWTQQNLTLMNRWSPASIRTSLTAHVNGSKHWYIRATWIAGQCAMTATQVNLPDQYKQIFQRLNEYPNLPENMKIACTLSNHSKPCSGCQVTTHLSKALPSSHANIIMLLIHILLQESCSSHGIHQILLHGMPRRRRKRDSWLQITKTKRLQHEKDLNNHLKVTNPYYQMIQPMVDYCRQSDQTHDTKTHRGRNNAGTVTAATLHTACNYRRQ